MKDLKIGDKVSVEDTNVKGKITHIRWDRQDPENTKVKVDGKYWNVGGVVKESFSKESNIMETDQLVKHVVKEEPVKVKETVSEILKQKIAEQFKNSVGK